MSGRLSCRTAISNSHAPFEVNVESTFGAARGLSDLAGGNRQAARFVSAFSAADQDVISAIDPAARRLCRLCHPER